MDLDKLKVLFIDTFKDPITGWFNPIHDLRIRKDYFNTTGQRLPDISKVEKFDPKVVEPIGNKGIGWYTKVQIPPSSRQINSNQYIVPRNKIIPYQSSNKAPIKIIGGRLVGLSPQALAITGGIKVLEDNYNMNKLKEESKNRIKYLKDFHTGPDYLSYPDDAEGRASRWAAQILFGDR